MESENTAPAAPAAPAPKKAPVSPESLAQTALDLAEKASADARRALEESKKHAFFASKAAPAAPSPLPAPAAPPPAAPPAGDFVDALVTFLTGIPKGQ